MSREQRDLESDVGKAPGRALDKQKSSYDR